MFWECVPVSRDTADRPFADVMVPSPALSRLRPDARPFAAHLRAPAAAFPNLGHDAVLVAPGGAHRAASAHVASWCRAVLEGPDDELHGLWQRVGEQVEAWWARRPDPVWVSTSGLGVSWLHVRLDERPKYVTWAPFREWPAAG